MSSTIQKSRIPTFAGQELRSCATKLSVRNDGGLEGIVSGYASVFDTPYSMPGGFDETVHRSAFDKTLASRPDVQLTLNHQGLPLARTTVPPGRPGHLQLSTDDRGLRFEARLDRNDPDTQTVLVKLTSGLLDQASFAFRCIRDDWSSDRSLRTLQEVSLARGDVSIVNYGASPSTTVAARSRQNGRGYPPLNPSVELILRAGAG